MQNKTILVPGGLGFIGSHTVCQLHQHGYQTIIIDDLSNSNRGNLANIEQIIGQKPIFYLGDYADKTLLHQIIEQYTIDAVILFAGSKYVAESVAEPLHYYHNNVAKSVVFIDFLSQHNINKLVFSSSATIYGDNPNLPIKETEPMAPPSPYGQTKSMIEQVINDVSIAKPDFCARILRYFNPTGAHPSGLLGETLGKKANNLMPAIMQVAIGQRPNVSIFGDDYDTPDGTGIRDYIHVMDLANGHIAALNNLFTDTPRVDSYNLGTGQGYSVLAMINSFEQACGRPIPYQIHPRRPGDIAISYADVSKARTELHWQTEKNLNNMTNDVWHYLQHNQ